MIEVMIALLVLAVGLLGLAGLQGMALRENASAGIQTQALYLSNDMLDRMRANWQAALNQDYDIAIGTAPASPAYEGMVLSDLTAWKSNLAELPGGDGAIDVSGSQVTVVVRWADGGSGTQTLEASSRLQ